MFKPRNVIFKCRSATTPKGEVTYKSVSKWQATTVLLFSLMFPKTGVKKWNEKTSDIMDEQHQLSLPVFRSQIDHILKKEKKTNFVGYMNKLHKIGEKAYKRSNIPNEHIAVATKELEGIKRVSYN